MCGGFRHLILVLVSTFCLLACSNGPSSPDIVTLALDGPPVNLDPRVGVDAYSERIDHLIFNSLVRKSDSSGILPDLAESWEIPDATTYIFHLRSNVRFHDGRELTADDVVYTFKSILDGTVQTSKLGTYRLVDTIEALDPQTVRFTLTEPYAPFLWNLALPAIGIVPEGAGTDFSDHPVGSGPFVFEHYVRDSEVVLRSNPDYFGEAPQLDAIRFKIVPDAVVRALELRKGTVDIVLNMLPADMVEALREESHLEVLNSEGTNAQYLAFNLEDPLFSDVRVRRAIAHAVDREAIVKYLWRNQARLADSLLPPENWAYSSDVSRYGYDPELARSILDDAGYDEISFTYRTSTDPLGLLVAAVLQQQFKDLRIDMQIRSNEFATFFSDVVSGNFQMYSLRWIGGNNDPDIFNLVFHSDMFPPNGANRGHYSNPEVDRWIELARRETDVEIRKAYYADIQKTLSDDLPYVNLYYTNNVAVVNKRIEGMKLYLAGDYEFLTQIRVRESAE
jgi:peptide/nickel transport system substrate-binding protein